MHDQPVIHRSKTSIRLCIAGYLLLVLAVALLFLDFRKAAVALLMVAIVGLECSEQMHGRTFLLPFALFPWLCVDPAPRQQRNEEEQPEVTWR